MIKTEEFENKIKNKESVDEIEYIDSKKLLREEVYKSGYTISEVNTALGINNYLYEILDANNKKKYARDLIISILIYIKTDIDNVQNILQGFGHSKLYVRVERDKVIFEEICNGRTLLEIEEKLNSKGFEPLLK